MRTLAALMLALSIALAAHGHTQQRITVEAPPPFPTRFPSEQTCERNYRLAQALVEQHNAYGIEPGDWNLLVKQIWWEAWWVTWKTPDQNWHDPNYYSTYREEARQRLLEMIGEKCYREGALPLPDNWTPLQTVEPPVR